MSEEPWCILCTHWDYGTIAEAMRIEDEEEGGEQEKLLHCVLFTCVFHKSMNYFSTWEL